VVYEHFGEGDYAVTENNIRYLLGLGTMGAAADQTSIAQMINSYKQTPETYLGFIRAEHFANQAALVQNRLVFYKYPAALAIDNWALNGGWTIYADKIVAAQSGAAIKLHFTAKNIYAVMGVAGSVDKTKPLMVKLLLNDKPVVSGKGKDVNNSQISVSGNRLYSLIQSPTMEEGVLELMTTSPGVEMYTFTFSN
jgi:hypothetical protein